MKAFRKPSVSEISANVAELVDGNALRQRKTTRMGAFYVLQREKKRKGTFEASQTKRIMSPFARLASPKPKKGRGLPATGSKKR